MCLSIVSPIGSNLIPVFDSGNDRAKSVCKIFLLNTAYQHDYAAFITATVIKALCQDLNANLRLTNMSSM